MIDAIKYLRRFGYARFSYVYGPNLAAFYCLLSLAAVVGISFLAVYR